MPRTIRALAGILYVGETSLPRALACLDQQQGVELRTVMIGHHPFADAHRHLYRTFDERRREHDVLVKVDADMEIVEPRLLHALGAIFERYEPLDQVIIGVDDWLSGERINGMQAWRNGTRWRSAPSALFADLPETSARTKLKVLDPPYPLVLHATSPSAAQSLRYGAQRGLKVVETLKRSRLDRMESFVRFAAANPAPERSLAVAGAEVALFDLDLARRCMFGTSQLTPAEMERLLGRSISATLFEETLGRLADLEPAITTAGTMSDKPGPSISSGPLARITRAAKRVGRSSEQQSPDAKVLREEFLGLLRG